MRRLVVLVVGLLLFAGVVAELLAPSWVAAQAEAAIAEGSGDRVAVDVEVSGPPLLLPVALSGEVASWIVRVSEVAGTPVPVDVVVDLDEVTLDRGALVRGDVRVTAVDRARATVTVDLASAVPPALQPFADRLAEAGLTRLLEAVGGDQVTQRGGDLVIGGFAVPLVEGSCDVTADGGVVTSRCDLAEIPAWLLSALE